MLAVMIISFIIIFIVIFLAVITTSKAYKFKHTIDETPQPVQSQINEDETTK